MADRPQEHAPGVLTGEQPLRHVATALDGNKKRKHEDVLDIPIEQGHVSARQQSAELRNRSPDRESEDAFADELAGSDDEVEVEVEDDEVDGELLEEIIDTFDLEPYVAEDGTGMSNAEIERLHAQLRADGPQKFFQDHIVSAEEDPRWLGQAFGLHPDLDLDDDSYLQLLGMAVMRFFYKRQKLKQYNTIDDVASLLQESKKIVVITGAGISTSLGIPDFRSKTTGFYDKVRAQGFEDAEAVFSIVEFDEDPSKFYTLAGDLLPAADRTTPTHAFIRLLQDKDKLLTNYTQNIDNIESIAGIDEAKFVQCHGSFATASCRKCRHRVKGTEIFDDIRNKRVAICTKCTEALKSQASLPQPQVRSKKARSFDSEDDDDEDDNIPQPGVMKPDITFFGEQLPDQFFDRLTEHDAKEVDLVIVMGTSLKVAPVSEVPNYLPHHVPHIFISKEPIAHIEMDVQLLGNCDDVVTELCRRAGWDFKHDMTPADFKVDVLPSERNSHTWSIAQAAT